MSEKENQKNYNKAEADEYISLSSALRIINEQIPISRKTFTRLCGFDSKHPVLFKKNTILIKVNDNYYIKQGDIDVFIKRYNLMVNVLLDKSKYLEISEFAKMKKVSRRTIERLVAKGKYKKAFYNKKTYIKI